MWIHPRLVDVDSKSFCFITYFDLKNQSKLSAFTSITAQIKLCDSHHVSQTLKVMFTVVLRCQE